MTAATDDITGINLNTFADGTFTLTVTLTNPAGTVGPEVTANPVINRSAPTDYTVTPDQTTFNATTAKDAGFTIKGAVAGYTYNYFVRNSSSISGSVVQGSGTITSATRNVTGIDISSVPDGSLTFGVGLTNQIGNTGAFVFGTATLNTVIPAGYSIVEVPVNISPATATSTAFTFTGATVGTKFNYTVTSSGGAGSVTGSGTVTSATENVSAINVSGLSGGTLTYSVTLTNSVGNTGTAATATATYFKTSPNGFSMTPDQSLINSVDVTSAGFTLASAEVGSTYKYTISGASGTPVTGNGTVTTATQDITGINLSSLPDGITFSVTLTDEVGNVSNPQTATATIDREAPTSLALSTSIATDSQVIGSLVGLLQTVGPQSTSSYTYSLVSGAGSTDNASFQISGNELQTGATLNDGQSYSVRIQSTDTLGKSIAQQFTITAGDLDPITPLMTLNNSSVAGSGTVGTLGTEATSGGVIGTQVNYSLVSGAGSDNNSSFQVVGNQLETVGTVTPGTYTVRIRSSSTYLLSDVAEVGGITSPYALEIPLDSTQLPGGNYESAAANAGLITLGSDNSGSWEPAVSANKEATGSLAQTNYQGSYASFWASVVAANPSATLANVVGSSGVDTANGDVWAVVDQSGEYAASTRIYTEQAFTITVM